MIYGIIILSIIMCVLYLIYKIYKLYTSIEEINLKELDDLCIIEKEFGKKYPMGDDKFQIIHYPHYSSFFTQFNNYTYLVKKTNKKIIGTCCFAYIKNNIYYVCDLKKIDFDKKNFTFDFFAYAYLHGIKNTFGIIMEPNIVINSLTTKYGKYGYKKILTLNLYKITFKKLKENMNLISEIFPNFYIVEGYKKFVFEKSNNVLNCFHIAQNDDLKIVSRQNMIDFEMINDIDCVMFCLCSTSYFNNDLQSVGINIENQMAIVANKYYTKQELNFNLIKTYMI